ncbi:alpha/beta fold hydrolase [Bdellovibrionota bacterium FG-1]
MTSRFQFFGLLASGLLCLGLASSFSTDSFASVQISTECFSFQHPLPWFYCLNRTEGSDSPDVLYYLHGAGGNERSWVDNDWKAKPIGEAWAAAGISAPLVVSVSFGAEWILADVNSSPVSGLLRVFVDEVLPKIEKKLGQIHGRRLLMGESMGGFNATQLILKFPRLFSRAVIACPVIADLSPYADPNEVQRFVRQTGANFSRVSWLLGLLGRYFGSESAWDHASPLRSALSHLGPGSPALHISCGRLDDFGIFEEAHRFAQIAQANGVPEVEWQPLEGGHCVIDQKAIALFLMSKH